MLPYFEQPVWSLGPLSIHAFGIAVSAAFLFGMVALRRRLVRLELDEGLGDRAGWWILIGGLAGAHLFSVLLYFPNKLRADPWLILRFWEDISSFGGILGGLVGALLFFAIRDSLRQAGRSWHISTRSHSYSRPLSPLGGRDVHWPTITRAQ
jgi:phosphatidylglycerol:prolipoprotein diacylglycerol transferase